MLASFSAVQFIGPTASIESDFGGTGGCTGGCTHNFQKIGTSNIQLPTESATNGGQIDKWIAPL